MIFWENLCLPKLAGGLGFRDTCKWNKAAIFKHIWAIAEKKDNLWVRWVHHVFLKGESIWEHRAPQTASYNGKKLMEIRDEFGRKETIIARVLEKGYYRLSNVYKEQMEDNGKFIWAVQVWNRFNVPKPAFIL